MTELVGASIEIVATGTRVVWSEASVEAAAWV